MIEFLQQTIERWGSFAVQIVVAAAVFFLIEKLRPAERIGFIKPEFKEELGFAAFNKLLLSPLLALVGGSAAIILANHNFPYKLMDEYLAGTPFWAQLLLALLFMDFSTYWRHRLMHRFFWPVHAVHHSAQHLSWITALRLHPIEVCISVFIDASFMYVFGFHTEAIMYAILIAVFYNYFVHSNINVAYPRPLRYIFASPVFHRWHHANEKAAYDKNFCGMFSLLDITFGTYYHPENALPKLYGLSAREQREYPANFKAQLFYPLRNIFKRK